MKNTNFPFYREDNFMIEKEMNGIFDLFLVTWTREFSKRLSKPYPAGNSLLLNSLIKVSLRCLRNYINKEMGNNIIGSILLYSVVWTEFEK